VIATQHDSHRPLAVAAARAGKHLLIEKPLALTLDDCRAIDVPALLLAGTATRAPALRIAELVASALPHVNDERLPGGTHVEALESPARIVRRIAQFVGEIDARTGATSFQAAA
jgi:pimeloyl-ACP methyl ester carboxylesterase